MQDSTCTKEEQNTTNNIIGVISTLCMDSYVYYYIIRLYTCVQANECVPIHTHSCMQLIKTNTIMYIYLHILYY